LNCYLSGVSYSLGDQMHIDTLNEEAATLTSLKAKGLASYRNSTSDFDELIIESIEATLEKTHCNPNDVDGIMFISDSFKFMPEFSSTGINHILRKLELFNAKPYGTSLSECANLSYGLQLGHALITSGASKNILVVVFDRLDPTLNSRLVDFGLGVFSDGVASCLLHSAGNADYKLIDVSLYQDIAIDLIDVNTHIEEYFSRIAQGLKTVCSQLLEKNNLTPSHIDKLFANNYVEHTLNMFVNHIGFNEQQSYFDNIPRLGHVFSADTLINLEDYANETTLVKDSLYVLLSTADSRWGSALIQKV